MYVYKIKLFLYELKNMPRLNFEHVKERLKVKNLTLLTLDDKGFCTYKCKCGIEQKATVRNVAIRQNRYGLCKICAKQKKTETMKKTYRVEHALQFEEFKEKFKQTCLINHGVEFPGQSKKIQEKSKQTQLEKYGVLNVMQSEEFIPLKENVLKL